MDTTLPFWYAHGVSVESPTPGQSLLRATSNPTRGKPQKPTALLQGPLSDGALHALEVVVKKKKQELRVGIAHREGYLAVCGSSGEPGYTFHSQFCRKCVAHLTMWGEHAAFFLGDLKQQKVDLNISEGDVLRVEFDRRPLPATGVGARNDSLRVYVNGVLGAQLSVCPGQVLGDTFAIQLYDAADAVLARPPTTLTSRPITLAHLSDTHGHHREIEGRFGLPHADILLHTGDWCAKSGVDEEHTDFNRWLGEIKERYDYKRIVVISGNHEWGHLKKCKAGDEHVSKAATSAGRHLQDLLPNATVLEHQGTTLFGLRIYGSSWVPWTSGADPDTVGGEHGRRATWETAGSPGTPHRFGDIPYGCDVLLTHGPPRGILDMSGAGQSWGSSAALRRSIEAAGEHAPLVHCFGHLHEQRGVWTRQGGGGGAGGGASVWVGGVEYEKREGVKSPTWPPPPPTYPGQVVSCNAMLNNSKIDGKEKQIAGGARLLVASPVLNADGTQAIKSGLSLGAFAQPGLAWRFHVDVSSARER
jgi:hypothetical protein